VLTTGGHEVKPSWSWTMTSGHYSLAYESDTGSGGNGQIYTMKDDGTSQVQVEGSDSGYNDADPAWSPDGHRLYFISTQGTNAIWYYDTTNSYARTRLGSVNFLSLDQQLKVSANSSTVAFTKDTYPQIYTIAASDGSTTQITSTGSSYLNYAPTFVWATAPNAPAPSWWKGSTCDYTTGHNNSTSHALTHTEGGQTVTTSYRGVIACAGGNGYSTDFGSGGTAQFEWECVELVKRYMYLMYGIPPYSADGKDIVNNYSGSIMEKVTNNGTRLPVPGDILQYDAVSPNNLTHGHTSIVTAVSVSGGSGTVTTIEQNASSTGVGTVDGIKQHAWLRCFEMAAPHRRVKNGSATMMAAPAESVISAPTRALKRDDSLKAGVGDSILIPSSHS